ncbi:MAG: RICIN domain-containing protein, partial [Coriobacteriales bacterium]|nr:RICIN domain-containing protein [Coriobacteriales bacterium]
MKHTRLLSVILVFVLLLAFSPFAYAGVEESKGSDTSVVINAGDATGGEEKSSERAATADDDSLATPDESAPPSAPAPDDAADESVSSDVPDPSASDPLAGEVPEGDPLEADPPTDDSALTPLALPAPLTTSSTYLIRPLASKNAVLDVLAGSKTKGANITVFKAHEGPNEQFKLVRFSGDLYFIQNVNSGMVLDVDAQKRANNANVSQYTKRTTADNNQNQLWTITKDSVNG